MFSPEWWSQSKRPLALTVVRDPWDTLVSEFRYLVKCCVKHRAAPDTAKATWCLGQCTDSFTHFVAKCAKNTPHRCSSQFRYVAGDLPVSRAALERYNLVIPLDRLDEGLALLHVLYGLALKDLVYMAGSNRNTAVRALNVTQAVQARITRELLRVDTLLVNEARAKLNRTLSHLDVDRRSRVDATAAYLARTNAKAYALCKDRRGEDCLASPRTGAFHAGACYTDCVERVALGQRTGLPSVKACETCRKRFRTNCQECECVGDGTARCKETLTCGGVPPTCLEEDEAN